MAGIGVEELYVLDQALSLRDIWELMRHEGNDLGELEKKLKGRKLKLQEGWPFASRGLHLGVYFQGMDFEETAALTRQMLIRGGRLSPRPATDGFSDLLRLPYAAWGHGANVALLLSAWDRIHAGQPP